MSDSKHTPEKWTNGWGGGITGPTCPSISNPTVDKERKYIPISKNKECIAIVIEQDNPNGIKQMQANAALIAQSPAMYTFITDYIDAMKGKLTIHETALLDSAKQIVKQLS